MSAHANLNVIDADAHVVENEHTWDYLEGSEKKYRPSLVPNPKNPLSLGWMLVQKGYVVAAIDGLALLPRQPVPWRRFGWSVVCWVALAKPWFFTGPYLDRLSLIPSSREAVS